MTFMLIALTGEPRYDTFPFCRRYILTYEQIHRKKHFMKSSINRYLTYTTNKWARPFSEKQPFHVVLKSEMARGKLSLRAPGNYQVVDDSIRKMAGHFDIRLFHFAIESTHVHLVIMAPTRTSLSGFLSSVAGVVARKILSAQKGLQKGIRFWAGRPYSRVLSWGRELRNVLHYVQRNILEARGRLAYSPRDRKISDSLRAFIVTSYRNTLPQMNLPLLV